MAASASTVTTQAETPSEYVRRTRAEQGKPPRLTADVLSQLGAIINRANGGNR